MQQIIYAGDEYLTGDRIADALLAYSRALGDDEQAQVVEIPVREDDGTVVTAKFLIGPASQIVSKEVHDSGPELEDPELIERLLRLARAVEAPEGGHLELSDDDEFEIR